MLSGQDIAPGKFQFPPKPGTPRSWRGICCAPDAAPWRATPSVRCRHEDVSEKLDIVPAEFFVHRHIYGKLAWLMLPTPDAGTR
jgi:hypothetical protein